jgi:uncharacterized delta-60 repeat protein
MRQNREPKAHFFCSSVGNISNPLPLAVLVQALGIFLFLNRAFSQGVDRFDPDANNTVSCLAIQADGRIILGGSFTKLAGQTALYIGRVNPDGTSDPSFSPEANKGVECLAIQEDGNVLVGGSFTRLNGQRRVAVARLHTDGTLDDNFHPGTNGFVAAFALQPDGRILMGGEFITLDGKPRQSLGRVEADGTLDTTFSPKFERGAQVRCIALQPDGKVVIAGTFSGVNGQAKRWIARLNGDGSTDGSFNNPVPNDFVNCLAVEPDGAILAGGFAFRTGIARLDPDGTADANFFPAFSYQAFTLALQTDGYIWLGGFGHNYIDRLRPDGTPDESIQETANSFLNSIALQPNGRLLASGLFTIFGGETRNHIARLINTEAATESLTYDGSAITWMRGGSSPEVWRARFEYSRDSGTTWTTLGEGSRIAGGWRLTGVSLPVNANIRARGYTTGGVYNGSTWFVETIIGPLIIVSQPRGQILNAGQTASFTIYAGGDGPIKYQWRKEGANLIDEGKFSGTGTSTLTISNVLGAEAGDYSVFVGNASGSITSLVARLAVIDPLITVQPQPAEQERNAGDTLTLSVTASGSEPLIYQWRKDEIALTDRGSVSGANTPILTVTNILHADAGLYSALIINSAGTITSTVSLLKVVEPFISTDPTTQLRNSNESVTFEVTAKGTPPLSYQWRRGGVPLAGATERSLTLTNLKGLDAGNYDVLVTSKWGTSTSKVAALTVNVAFVDNFNPDADGSVELIVPQANKKILVAGEFNTLGKYSRTYFSRLNPDGSLDTDFNPRANNFIRTLSVQSEERILIGGDFTGLGDSTWVYLASLNSEGFANGDVWDFVLNGGLTLLTPQANDQLLIAGAFTDVAREGHAFFARLNSSFALDPAFNPVLIDRVSQVAFQEGARILVGMYGSIARLNLDGSSDSTFSQAADGSLSCLLVQPDGKILVAGAFGKLAGETRLAVGRLNSDGSLDSSFDPGANGPINCMGLQADGKILVGGAFTTLGNQARNHIGRINPDGSLDLTFNPGTDGDVRCMAVQDDGSILLGGDFLSAGGETRRHIARLKNTISGTRRLSYDNSTVTWLRDGAISEVERSTLEYSLDSGTSWLGLGQGTRVAGGWEFMGINLPTNTTFRARGYASANGSSWFVEDGLGPLVIAAQPLGREKNAGDAANFNATAIGTAPVSYQWRKDAVPVSGATQSSLIFTNLQAVDQGNYDVVMSNSWGAITSSVAPLGVN